VLRYRQTTLVSAMWCTGCHYITFREAQIEDQAAKKHTAVSWVGSPQPQRWWSLYYEYSTVRDLMFDKSVVVYPWRGNGACVSHLETGTGHFAAC
jgi:hypothetical protein